MQASKWRVNPYIGIDNDTFADPRLTFTASGVLATLHAKAMSRTQSVFTLDDLPSPVESRDEIQDAVDLLIQLGYLMEARP